MSHSYFESNLEKKNQHKQIKVKIGNKQILQNYNSSLDSQSMKIAFTINHKIITY